MTFRIGKWEVHDDANAIVHGMETRRIDPRAMRALVLLAQNVGDVVTDHQLIEQIWYDHPISERAVATVVDDLRRALGDDRRDPQYIEILPRGEFRLISTVWGLADQQAQPLEAASPVKKIRPVTPSQPDHTHGNAYGYHEVNPEPLPNAANALASALNAPNQETPSRPKPVLSAVDKTLETPPNFLMEPGADASPAPTAKPRRRRAPKSRKKQMGWLSMGLGLAALAVAATVGISFLGPRFAAPESLAAIPIASNRLVITDFQNTTGQSDLTFAGRALNEIVTVDLVPHLAGRLMRWRDGDMAPQNSRATLERILPGRLQGSMINGRITMEGQNPSLDVELSDLASGSVVWSNRYPLDLDNLTGLAANLGGDIAGKLGTGIANTSWRTENPDVYELYWRAKYMWSLRRPKQDAQAVRILRDIVGTYPKFVPAHATLADIYAHRSGLDLNLGWLDTFREAERHLRQAKAIDPTFEGLKVTQAIVQFYRDRNPRAALPLIDSAIKERPSDARAWQLRALVLSAMGYSEYALSAIERARAIDPLSGTVLWDKAWTLYIAGQFDDALAAAKRARRFAGPNPLYEALIHDARNDTENALKAWVAHAETKGLSNGAARFVHMLIARGDHVEAYQSLCNWDRHDPKYTEASLPLAIFHARARDRDGLLNVLRTADATRDRWWWIWADVIPALTDMKTDRRAASLLRRMKLRG